MTAASDDRDSGAAGANPPFPPIPEAAWSVDCDFVHPHSLQANHDKPEVVDPPFHGAPFGGFGGGTFARTYRGDFARWHLRTGRHIYRSLPTCFQAIAVHEDGVRKDAFALGPDPTDGSLGHVQFRNSGCRYHALYPFSWFEGKTDECDLRWRLTQFSPIIPDNYRESSLPVGVFRWHFHNPTQKKLLVSVVTSWENISIENPGSVGGFRSVHVVPEAVPPILWLGRIGPEPRSDEEGAFAIAAGGGSPFFVPIFDATGDGDDVWSVLVDPEHHVGTMGRPEKKHVAQGTGRCGGAIGVRVEVPPGETREAAFALSWHFPVFSFGSGRRWFRRHTHFYLRGVGRGDGTDPACRLAADALRSREFWQDEVENWQRPILANRPAPLARHLFNSLYVLADSGTAWENGELLPADEDEPYDAAPAVPGSRKIGRFSILECFTYPYYATLDVRYYGGLPLLFLWPEIERQVLLQFAAAAGTVDTEKREMVHVKESVLRKRMGTMPHDLGAPTEDPWVKVNAYDDVDPNRWKDLGPKFVLQVARYLGSVGWEDRGFLRAIWPAVRSALKHLSAQDKDGDGLPENEGIPDQTFDKWPMKGPSAYCSMLTAAALTAGEEIAGWCGEPGAAREYSSWRRKAVRSIHKKLVRDDYLLYDESPRNEGMVMAGQLSGEWSLALCGLPPILEESLVKKVLETIARDCRCVVMDRSWGLRNGAPRYGTSLPDNRHGVEVWPGINYAVASHMILAGLRDEAMEICDALSRVMYEDRPFAFVTPEAWDDAGDFRGAMYMRAMAVWGVEEALRRMERRSDLLSFFSTEEPE